MSHSTRTAPALALLLLAAAVAGCIGATEETGPDLPAETSVRFDSFEDARAADGPTYKPQGQADPYFDSQSAQVTDANYSESYDVPVEADAKKVQVLVSFDSGSQLDDVQVRLLDADGAEKDSANLGPDTAEANLTATEATPTGNWTIAVDGMAFSASYDLGIEVTYENTHPLTLKLYEPTEAISPGDHAFVFLLYDADADEPITDANVTLESWATSMGHGSDNEEADPVHFEHGVHVGRISPSMDGNWEVRVDVDLSDGESLRFAVPIEM